jgi:ferredoxin-NADP reductase
MNEYKYQLQNIAQPSSDLVVLDIIDPKGRPIFAFRPGQYVMLSYRNEQGNLEEKHAFSIASAPTETNVLRLGIRVGGRFTQGLLLLKAGAEIIVYGPFGAFNFDETKHHNAVFIAGGIGITPFLSALAYATDKKLSNNFSLIYSSRKLQGIAFFDRLRQLENNNPNFKALYSVTDDATSANLPGVINDRVGLEVIKQFIESPTGKTFFLCGPAPFMNAMREHLLKFGASEDQILMEEFAMLSYRSFIGKMSYLGSLVGYGALAALLPFYMVYAANTKTSGEPILDKIFKDNDTLEAEKNQTVLGEVAEHLPVAKLKEAVKSVNGSVAGQTAENVFQKIGSSIQSAVNKTTDLTTAPKPKTASSIPANETKAKTTTTQAAKQTAGQVTNKTVAPAPTTGASSASASAPAPTNTQTTNTASNAPAPTTGASGSVSTAPAGTAQTSNNTASVSNSAPAPVPTTSASGVTTSPGASSGSTGGATVIGAPTTGSTGSTRHEREDD